MMEGRAIQIVIANPDHTFRLDRKALASIVSDANIKEKEIVVISVVGAFRKGKSFLLNWILRFLEAEGSPDWLGDEQEPLKGFSWRGGYERDTTGILVWSKIFMVKDANGEKIPVLLLDTQGAFDSQTNKKDSATIFALSTLISSIQVYNLSQNIQENDLEHLQLFTEYGRLALENSGDVKPFQNLQFLVRDWSYPYAAPFGSVGGQKILDERLKVSENQDPEHKRLREDIGSCFSSISCFLMPYPGPEVATNPEFDGQLSVIESKFKDQLKIFIEQLFSPEKLVPKQIGGNRIKAGDLVYYFECLVDNFNGDKYIGPNSILQATAEAHHNLSAVEYAYKLYTSEMGKRNVEVGFYSLDKQHLQARDEVLKRFKTQMKMVREDISEKYQIELEKTIEEMFVHYQNSALVSNFAAVNDAKLHYSNAIEGICGREKPFLSSYLLLKEHLRVKDEAVKQFLGQDKQKMGGKDFSEKYQMDLEQEISALFLLYQSQHESKRPSIVSRVLKTFASLFPRAMYVYLAWLLMDSTGFYPPAYLFNIAIGMIVIVFSTLAVNGLTGEPFNLIVIDLVVEAIRNRVFGRLN